MYVCSRVTTSRGTHPYRLQAPATGVMREVLCPHVRGFPVGNKRCVIEVRTYYSSLPSFKRDCPSWVLDTQARMPLSPDTCTHTQRLADLTFGVRFEMQEVSVFMYVPGCCNRVLVVEILGLGIIIGKGRGDGQLLPKVALSVARLEMQCRLQQARQDIG